VLSVQSSAETVRDAIEREAKKIEPQMLGWRRDIYQNPELGNSELRTSALVATHLRQLSDDIRKTARPAARHHQAYLSAGGGRIATQSADK